MTHKSILLAQNYPAIDAGHGSLDEKFNRCAPDCLEACAYSWDTAHLLSLDPGLL